MFEFKFLYIYISHKLQKQISKWVNRIARIVRSSSAKTSYPKLRKRRGQKMLRKSDCMIDFIIACSLEAITKTQGTV